MLRTSILAPAISGSRPSRHRTHNAYARQTGHRTTKPSLAVGSVILLLIERPFDQRHGIAVGARIEQRKARLKSTQERPDMPMSAPSQRLRASSPDRGP